MNVRSNPLLDGRVVVKSDVITLRGDGGRGGGVQKAHGLSVGGRAGGGVSLFMNNPLLIASIYLSNIKD